MTLTSNPQSHFHPFFLSAAQRFKMTSTAEWVEADEAALMATTFNNLTHLNIKIAFASSGHPPMSCVLAQACYGKVTTWPMWPLLSRWVTVLLKWRGLHQANQQNNCQLNRTRTQSCQPCPVARTQISKQT